MAPAWRMALIDPPQDWLDSMPPPMLEGSPVPTPSILTVRQQADLRPPDLMFPSLPIWATTRPEIPIMSAQGNGEDGGQVIVLSFSACHLPLACRCEFNYLT